MRWVDRLSVQQAPADCGGPRCGTTGWQEEKHRNTQIYVLEKGGRGELLNPRGAGGQGADGRLVGGKDGFLPVFYWNALISDQAH